MKQLVSNLGSVGLITDYEAEALPPEGWSDLQNIRCQLNWCGSFKGSTVNEAITYEGHYIVPLLTSSNAYLVYPHDSTGNGVCNKIAYSVGGSSTDITRAAGGDYTGTGDWSGTVLSGIAIINNDSDRLT